MSEEIFAGLIGDALAQSSASFGIADVLLLVFANLLGVGLLFGLIYKFIIVPKKGGGVGLDTMVANEAHEMMLTKDNKQIPVFLRIPEYFDKITDYMEKIDRHFIKQNTLLKNLYNHQSDRINDIEKKVD